MATPYIGGYAKTYGPYVQAGVVTPRLSAPANLRQTAGSSTSNTLAWDAVTGADGYELRRGSLNIYSGPALNFADTGLSAATGYGYTVRALDSTGASLASSYSATLTATTAGNGNNKSVLIVAEGDSLTYGNDIPDKAYPIKLQAILGSSYEVLNYGVNGQPISAALANPSVLGSLDAQIAAVDRSKYSQVIFLVDGGANDYRLLGQNYPTQDAVALTFAARKRVHAKIKAAGFLAVAMDHTNYNYTQPVTPSDLNATIRQHMVSENANIAAYWQSELAASAFVQLSADSRIGFDGANNSAYFQADGVHLNEQGNVVKAQLLALAVQALVAGQPYGTVTPLPVTNSLVVNDTDSRFAYSPGWAVSDASAGTPAAFIYSSGVAHTSPQNTPGTTLWAEYILPRNCSEVVVCWPGQTVPISMNVSVNGGTVKTIASPILGANESSSTEKGRIAGTFLAGQVVRFDNTPGQASAYAVVDKLILNGIAATVIEETDADWTYVGPWASQSAVIHSAGAAKYLSNGVAGSASRALLNCSSIDVWLCQANGATFSADYYIDNLYKATVITSSASQQDSALRLTIPGPFAAGQILKVTNASPAHDPNAANSFTYLDKIVLNG